MRKFVSVLTLASASLVATVGVVAQQPAARPHDPVAWAYNIAPPAPPGAKPNPETPAAAGGPIQLPGSSLSFTPTEINGGFATADWFPSDHPPLPEIVAKGRRPNVRACTLCHLANGKGKPENSPVAGLPYAYIVQTLADYRNGLRKSAEPRKTNVNAMIEIAKALTDEEIKTAAEYFSSMKWTPWVRVVEVSSVPKTRIQGGIAIPIDGGGMEPIGQRIIETPENADHTLTYRSPRSAFIAYAPIGSVKKGEALVRTGGNGRTVQCATCHGRDMKGLGPIPGIAGRSPSYVARQLYDFQQGARRGVWADLMKDAVEKLTEEDLVSISAYLASLTP